MKKIPVIGLLIGAVAACWALMKRKKGGEEAQEHAPGETHDHDHT